MSKNSSTQIYKDLAFSLQKDVVDKTQPVLETCKDLVELLVVESSNDSKMTIHILKETLIGKALGKAAKTFKRYKRSEGGEWSILYEKSQTLIKDWKHIVEDESKHQNVQKEKDIMLTQGLPKSTNEYKARLVKYKKEMYKDPPVLPPPSIAIEEKNYGLPQRNSKTGILTFKGEKGNKIEEFRPNRTPEEILRAGSFGGTYFRSIVSGVTNVHYSAKEVLEATVKPEWIKDLDYKTYLTSQTYRAGINKYGVQCGGSLGMWESSGWISDSDPYGWFQWYCRFYSGRRCDDDSRQISRWLKSAGEKGRFRSQLCNKILAANTRPDDCKISPVIRQTLLHWGLEITGDVLEKHRKRTGR
mmetsp:Transcript_30692/g.46490  ORF Transcript_30692/g.46490 Transcript_30692/m.46490 type:complete len:358 (+) Transcript_30692:112-1185(+)